MSLPANSIDNMATVRWKLADYMREHNITAYQLGKRIGGITRLSTVYRLAKPDEPPSRVEFQTLADVMKGLSELTGKDVQVTDLIEYRPDN